MSDRRSMAQSPNTKHLPAVASGRIWFAVGLLRVRGDFVQRGRDRRLLAGLDDRELRDIGLDRVAMEQDGTTWPGPRARL